MQAQHPDMLSSPLFKAVPMAPKLPYHNSQHLSGGRGAISSLLPYPWQALKGSFSLLPLPGEKSSDLEK